MDKKEGNPINIFLSYAHEDELLKERLDIHLSPLKRSGMINTWNDREIISGSDWNNVIINELESADIVLLLVSADFLASEYIWKVEVEKAMEKHQNKDGIIIPIFLKPCDWSDASFSIINGLPKDAKPVTKYEDMEEAFYEIARGIKKVIFHKFEDRL